MVHSISLDDLQRALDLLRPEKPDLLLLGGDYISESPRYLAGTAELLGLLAAETPLGCYAVMGNHDYSITGAYAIKALGDVGIPILRNDVAEVKVGSDSLWIAGIDETLLGSPDPDGTIGQSARRRRGPRALARADVCRAGCRRPVRLRSYPGIPMAVRCDCR